MVWLGLLAIVSICLSQHLTSGEFKCIFFGGFLLDQFGMDNITRMLQK